MNTFRLETQPPCRRLRPVVCDPLPVTCEADHLHLGYSVQPVVIHPEAAAQPIPVDDHVPLTSQQQNDLLTSFSGNAHPSKRQIQPRPHPLLIPLFSPPPGQALGFSFGRNSRLSLRLRIASGLRLRSWLPRGRRPGRDSCGRRLRLWLRASRTPA